MYQYHPVPVVYLLSLPLLYDPELLFWIVNECAELPLFALPQGMAKNHLDFFADDSRCVFQNMMESFVFAVDVGQEMFGSLWKVEDSFKIDDFGCGIGNGWEAFRE
ncbi:hypothetical protein SDC9_104734 [bioreactor metagenome]|uniref:Uncharacterized protein n=1 Tax=bioreactor metagenome TaxID=1076179 RepID=A0A645AXD7_9ZZZZ